MYPYGRRAGGCNVTVTLTSLLPALLDPRLPVQVLEGVLGVIRLSHNNRGGRWPL
jgi:hypothetical protein